MCGQDYSHARMRLPYSRTYDVHKPGLRSRLPEGMQMDEPCHCHAYRRLMLVHSLVEVPDRGWEESQQAMARGGGLFQYYGGVDLR